MQLAGEDTPQARGFFSKIWLWALPFHKVIYIDTDILKLARMFRVLGFGFRVWGLGLRFRGCTSTATF